MRPKRNIAAKTNNSKANKRDCMMSQQASLPGFAPATATDRLFFAIFPDHGTARQIAAFAARECGRHGLHGKPLPGDRFHVTLFHLGDWVGLREDVVAAATQAASRVQAAPFDLNFDQVASFTGGRDKLPLVLKAEGAGNAALRAFHAVLGTSLGEARLGQSSTARFEPHITLTYDSHRVAAEAVASISWRACKFVLVHSLLGKTRHIPLRRWSLE